jgi:hypothetical protein
MMWSSRHGPTLRAQQVAGTRCDPIPASHSCMCRCSTPTQHANPPVHQILPLSHRPQRLLRGRPSLLRSSIPMPCARDTQRPPPFSLHAHHASCCTRQWPTVVTVPLAPLMPPGASRECGWVHTTSQGAACGQGNHGGSPVAEPAQRRTAVAARRLVTLQARAALSTCRERKRDRTPARAVRPCVPVLRPTAGIAARRLNPRSTTAAVRV